LDFFVFCSSKGGSFPQQAGDRYSASSHRLGPCSGGNEHQKIGKKLADAATVQSLEPKADFAVTEPTTVAALANPKPALSGH